MNRSRRGFTLVELVVAVGVFVTVSAAAFVFARSQIVARKQTQHLLDTEQNVRVALDSIRFDLQSSGLGTGYALNGVFSGLAMGPFGPFLSNDRAIPAHGPTDDLRIRGALGPVRTINAYTPGQENGTMEVCAGGGFEPDDVVLILSESYAEARAVNITARTRDVPCNLAEGECIGNGRRCDRLTFEDNSALFETDGNARFAAYQGGSAFRGYIDVTYFVEMTPAGPGLFRADRNDGDCPTRAACATPENLLGEGVESLQAQIWELDPEGTTPDDVTARAEYINPVTGGGVSSTNRVRVDIEVIARSRTEEADAPLSKECSAISGACYPRSPEPPDRYRRRKMMTSVELKNSGHMRFQALR